MGENHIGRVAPTLLWIFSCIPAGALAGIGIIEFNWSGPPYDGGFLGYLVLFGGFLALVQAPFAAWILGIRVLKPFFPFTVGWIVFGFVGWSVGQFVKVSAFPISYDPLNPSLLLWIVTSCLPWLTVGFLQGILCLAYFRSETEVNSRWPLLMFLFVWPVSCITGGVLLETWSSITYLEGWPIGGISGFLQSLGVAERVSGIVVAYAITIPVFYGIPTGLAMLFMPKIETSFD